MIKNVEREGNIFFAEFSDAITKEDIESVIPVVEELVSENKEIKCLMILNNLKNYSIGKFLADFSFFFKYSDNFAHIATVSEKEFKQGATGFFKTMLPGKAKCFSLTELDKAKEWIRQV